MRRLVFVLTVTAVVFSGAASAWASVTDVGRTGPTSLGRHSSVRHASAHDPSRHRRRRNQRRFPRRVLAHTSIIGGRIAEAGAFPWLAWIIDRRGEVLGQCTGTVVAPNLILTAGHCAEEVETGVVNESSGYRVVTGNVDWGSETERQVSSVSRVIVYPYFETSGPLAGWGDAALLVLSAPTTAPAIHLATAAESELWQPGTGAIMAGWGRTYYEQEDLTESLQWAETVVQGSEWCKNNASGFHARGQLCTINPPSYGTGGCNGDSGGPLLVEKAGAHKVVEIGILQGGYGKCSTTEPTVYTRSEQVAKWVYEWAEALKPGPTPSPTPAPSSTPPPAPSGPVAPTGPSRAPAGLSVKLQLLPESLKEMLRHGVSLKATVNETVDGIALISIEHGQAKRAHLAVTIGRGTVKGLVNGTVELRLRLSRKVATKIRRRLRHVTLTIQMTLLDRSGDKQTADVVGRY